MSSQIPELFEDGIFEGLFGVKPEDATKSVGIVLTSGNKSIGLHYLHGVASIVCVHLRYTHC